MKANRGFSLLEVMVVVGVIAILAAIAIPNMVSWRNKQQFLSATNSVHDAIKSARSYAIKSNKTVVITLRESGYSVKEKDGRTITAGSFPSGIKLTPGGDLSFDSRGLTNGATVTLKSTSYADRVIEVTVTGNTRVL